MMIYYTDIPVFINTVAFLIHDICYIPVTIICHDTKYILFKFDIQKRVMETESLHTKTFHSIDFLAYRVLSTQKKKKKKTRQHKLILFLQCLSNMRIIFV